MWTAALATAAQAKPRPEIMGVELSMSRDDARARLKSLGRLEREERKRQEVWAVDDPRISHLLIGYDADYRVRYVTAIARAGGPRIRYREIAELKHAQRLQYQGNYNSRGKWLRVVASSHTSRSRTDAIRNTSILIR